MDFSKFPVTLTLIILNAGISLLGFYNGNFVDKAIGWPYYEKRNNQYYRWVSSGFLHADWMHLIFNMIALYSFGRVIELYFSAAGLGGEIAYLGLYFSALLIANVPAYIKHKDNYQYRSLGASGATSAIVFASIIFAPWMNLYIFGIVPIPAVLFAVIYIVYCVYMSKRNLDNIGHDAHLWGSVYGLLFTIVLILVLRPGIIGILFNKLIHPSLNG